MLTTVQLRRSAAPPRAAQAWYLPGGDPAVWLEEVARWPVPTMEVRFFPLPVEGGSDVAGVLAVPPEGAAALVEVRGLAYGCVAPGFFIPVEAELTPPLGDDELRASMRFPVLVFHPALGLIGFDQEEGARVTDWLAAPLAVAENWTEACVGVPPRPALHSVRLQAEVALDELFGEESKEIGSKADEPLPPAPNEPWANPVAGLLLGAAGLVVQGVLALSSLAPRTASAPTWINHLEGWLQGKLAGASSDLERARNKELLRLLHLLETNPEEGLRHALPLAALLNRGRANPGTRLGTRSTDFSLRRLGGGAPVDGWHVPADIQASLSKSYREQAMRELKLGRHRRAAYVFAELLGDLAAAADALKQGRHFQEAAVLYRERLNNPLAAAACLAEGGLLHEAIALYEKHERWLESADLYARLGDREAEVRAVRRVVDAAVQRGDVIAAARLIETRLVEPDEALVLLASTWPSGRQAMVCVEERLALLQRLKRSDAALDLVHELMRHDTAVREIAALATVLVRVVEGGGDEPLRRLAAEAVRVKASVGLAGRGLTSSDELLVLKALTRLSPGDRLLARDTIRFRAERAKAPPAPLKAQSKSVPIRRLTLSPSSSQTWMGIETWVAARSSGDGLLAVGAVVGGGLRLVQETWQGVLRSLDWADPAPQMGRTLLFASSSAEVLIARPFAPALEQKSFPTAARLDVRDHGPHSAGTPSWLPEGSVQAHWSQSSFWVVRVVGQRIVLDCFHQKQLTGSRDVTEELIAAGATGGGTALRIDAGAGGGRVALGYGSHLLIMENAREVRVRDLGARVLDVVAAPATTPGWVVALERGVVFVAAEGDGVRVLDPEIEMPRVAVLRLGEVVMAGAAGGLVYRLHADRVEAVGSFVLPGGGGFGITPTNDLNEFAVFGEKGVVQRWRLTN